MSKDRPSSYTAVAKWLHWIMAILWIVGWLLGMVAVYLREQVNSDHGITIMHKAVASSLLFFIVIRILWRLLNPPPKFPDSMSPALQRAAHVGHVLLYTVALVALPVSGWYWSSVADKPVLVLGLFLLPPLVEANQDLYSLAKWIHTLSAWGCGVLVGGHVLIALKHHFVDKDDVLKGMLLGGRSRGRREEVG